MRIVISNSSPIPIYEQIKKAIIDQILNNDLKENESLPSIRTLARDTKISVMTIKKAYSELENEGYITSIQGKGTFVASKNNGLVLENAQKEIETYLEKAIQVAINFDIKKEELISLLDIFYGEEDK